MTLTLKFGDNRTKEYDKETAMNIRACFPTLKDLVDDLPNADGESIPLPNVANQETFEIIFEYCKRFRDTSSTTTDDEHDFVNEYSEATLYACARAANYLALPRFTTLVARHVVRLLYNRTTDELNDSFESIGRFTDA